MVAGITRQDLQEEFQSLSNTVQLELRVEFAKLNKRLESLERLFSASRASQQWLPIHSTSQPRQPVHSIISEDSFLPAVTKFASEGTGRSSNLGSMRGSFGNSMPLKQIEKQGVSGEFTDLYFRSYVTGAEARQWQEQEIMGPQDDSTRPRGSSRKYVSAKKKTMAAEENGNPFTDMDQYPNTRKGAVKSTIRDRAMKLVSSPVFNGVIATMIFLNAVTLGVQTDHMATQELKEVPKAFKAIELTFCGIFTIEILLKLVAHRVEYFTASGWKWNVFDFFLVVMTIVEELLHAIVQFSFSNFSAIRVLRILRVVRIVRVIRLLRMIGELRAIVASVLGSLRSLCWTVLLLLSIIYIIGIYFTQLLIEERISGNKDLSSYTRYYGSLARSILTLYESISGGIDWDVAVLPLIHDISPFYGVVFGLYIAFTVLAIMNVVTGVFVESALQSAREDKDIYIVNHVRELIEEMTEHDGIIRWEGFQAKLDSREMGEVFKHIDVDMNEAPGVFRLLDLDGNGTIDPAEFLDGILKLGGPAKALDMALMMREIKRLTLKVQQMVGLWAAASSIHEIEPQSPLRQAAIDPPPVEDMKRLRSSIMSLHGIDHCQLEDM